MLRFKQFSGMTSELENAVNQWLEEFEPDVSQMTQTVTQDGTVVMGFLFEESFRGQELRLASQHGMSGAVTAPAIADDVQDRPIPVEEPGGPTG